MTNVVQVYEVFENLPELGQLLFKIVLSFFQITSTLLKSLDVPWPHVFATVMARVSVVNLNLVQLPKTACLNPNPSFYSIFNGYTVLRCYRPSLNSMLTLVSQLGLLFFICFITALHAFGAMLSHATLQGLTATERAERLGHFDHRLLVALLLVLYLVYPVHLSRCSSLDIAPDAPTGCICRHLWHFLLFCIGATVCGLWRGFWRAAPV
jgi:hypothetical protein